MTEALPTRASISNPDDALPPRRSVLGTLRKRPSGVLGAGVLLGFLCLALLAPLTMSDGETRVGPVYQGPSSRHWLGLDDSGSDVLRLLIGGTRISLVVGVAAMAVSILIGGGVGLAAGYAGGLTDSFLMRITDYFLVIPVLPLMILIAAIWRPSVSHLILVIGSLLWTWTARIIRAQVKTIRERAYVKRARALGSSHARIILRHVLPQVIPLLMANVILTVAYAIFYETALSFLGLGDPSSSSWGTMLRHAFERTAISSGAWWVVVPPGICIAVVVMSCYLLGQAIEESLNPRIRVAHVSAKTFRLRRAAEAPACPP